LSQRQQAYSVKLYLRNHAQHVSSISLKATEDLPVTLQQLPPELQLISLQLEWFDLQLSPGRAWLSGRGRKFQGVLGDASRLAALTQLRLTDCGLVDEPLLACSAGLAALSVLPVGLQHLSISGIYHQTGCRAHFPTGIFPQLQQLTYLELAGMNVVTPAKAKAQYFPPVFFLGMEGDGQGEGDEEEGMVAALQPLQALTRLVELRLDALQLDQSVASILIHCRITASMIPSTHLTCLVLTGGVQLEPDALAGKTQLQYLDLGLDTLSAMLVGAIVEVQLLPRIQPLRELTHLRLRNLWAEEGSPPAAAYAALTASSKLQHLDISECIVPVGVWAHMFPAGRQLPHLLSLNISMLQTPRGGVATAPQGSRLVGCCPSLQSLDVRGLRGLNAERLAPLQGLSGLHTLRYGSYDNDADGWQAVCQLTRLQELDLQYPSATQEQLLLSTQLQSLTRFVNRDLYGRFSCVLVAQVS
jgi:hypothetical protein